MPHKNTHNQTNRERRNKERSELVKKLSELLWDKTKPEGEEAVPEYRWEAVLNGPCNGDPKLIADVCAYERYLRDDSDPGEVIELHVPPEFYLPFVFDFLGQKQSRLNLLWDIP